MNEKINEQALAKLKGKLNSDVVSLSLRTTTPLNSEHFDQLRHWGGTLLYDEVLKRVAVDAEFVLSEQIRHSILQVTHA